MTIPNYITPAGFEALKTELHDLLHVQRPEIVKVVSWAASLGDRSENADYIYGKRRMREIDKRIRFLQSRLDNIQVIDPREQKAGVVKFGATVTLVDENNRTKIYKIVGVDEIDLSRGYISWQSPLARALIGKSCGDEISYSTPAGVREAEIQAVQYL